MKSKILKIAIFGLFSMCSFGQSENKNSFFEYDKFVNESKSHSKDAKHLKIEYLVNNIQPSVYIEFDGVKIYGQKPTSLFTSVKNFYKISNANFDKENVEIVNIRISNFDDLKNELDFSKLTNFKKLKYIYIVSDLKCNDTDILQIINNIGNYTVLYKIAQNS